MDDDRRRLEDLNPEPDGGAGWAGSEAGRRAYDRVAGRLDPSASLEPHRSRVKPWLIAAPGVAVLLAIGLPLLLLRGGEPGGTSAGPGATEATTTTVPPVTTTAVTGLTEWVFQGPVLDKQGVGPQLCMAVEESLPPQCQGMPVIGLDWADIPWAETAGDTTWAEARLVGTFDGETFTLTRPPAEPEPVFHPDEDPFATPCPEPDGGWAVTNPALATQEAFEAARRYAEAQADYAALWIDSLVEPSEGIDLGPATFVLNVRFTGNLEEHEATLREIYGGPLCVTTGAEVTEAELRSIQQQVHLGLDTPEAVAAGIYAGHGQGTGVDTLRGVVVATVFVVIDDAAAQAWLDAKWGPGLVEVSGMLERFEETTFPLHLYVSNQSRDIDPVAVQITLDGMVVVDQEFELGDMHNWVLFELQVAPGEHEIRATAPLAGAEMVETFVVEGEQWAVVDFWAASNGVEGPRFAWSQGHPIAPSE